MSDSTILYAGIVCFSLVVLAVVLTVREFSRIPATAATLKRDPKLSYRT